MWYICDVLQWIITIFITYQPETPNHGFFCWCDQAVFKNSCSGKNLSDSKTKFGPRVQIGVQIPMLYANHANCMKKFYYAFKQVKVPKKYILEDFLPCCLFKVLANKHGLTW